MGISMPRKRLARKREVVEALKARGLTMTDMARDLGVTTSHVSHFLSGRRYTIRLDEGIAEYIRRLPDADAQAVA